MVKYIRSTESPNVTRQERISHANRLLDLLSQRQERGELFRNLMVESKLECNRRAGPLDGQNANHEPNQTRHNLDRGSLCCFD